MCTCAYTYACASLLASQRISLDIDSTCDADAAASLVPGRELHWNTYRAPNCQSQLQQRYCFSVSAVRTTVPRAIHLSGTRNRATGAPALLSGALWPMPVWNFSSCMHAPLDLIIRTCTAVNQLLELRLC